MDFACLFVRVILDVEDEFHGDFWTILGLGLGGRHMSRRGSDWWFAGDSGIGAVVGHCRLLLALLLRSAYGELLLGNLAQ